LKTHRINRLAVLAAAMLGSLVLAGSDWVEAAASRTGSVWMVDRAAVATTPGKSPRLVAQVRHERPGHAPQAFVAGVDKAGCGGPRGVIELVGEGTNTAQTYSRGDGSVAEALASAICALPAARRGA
jgi:hypothetical protein